MPSEKTIVLITGANQGLGLEITKKLAAENDNYQIVMAGRSIDKVEKAASEVNKLATGTAIDVVQLDVSSDESISRAAATVDEKYGRLDVLVNNAGISGISSTAATAREVMHEIFDTNAAGLVVTTDAFVPLLKKSSAAQIVIMSSDLGSIGNTLNPEYQFYGMAERAKPYKISKAAANMAGAVYAAAYKDQGIRVNMVNPGFRATNLNNHAAMAGKKEDGALEACKYITDRDSKVTGAYSEIEGPLPW